MNLRITSHCIWIIFLSLLASPIAHAQGTHLGSFQVYSHEAIRPGNVALGAVQIDNPQPANLLIQLTSSSTSTVTVQGSVTINAGATSATFQLTGVAPGVALISGTLPPGYTSHQGTTVAGKAYVPVANNIEGNIVRYDLNFGLAGNTGYSVVRTDNSYNLFTTTYVPRLGWDATANKMKDMVLLKTV